MLPRGELNAGEKKKLVVDDGELNESRPTIHYRESQAQSTLPPQPFMSTCLTEADVQMPAAIAANWG